MVHNIAKSDTFAGFPAIAARDTLRDWVEHRGAPALQMTPSKRTPQDAASRLAILQEMEDKGWLSADPSSYRNEAYGRLTDEGRAFLHGATTKRVPRAKAVAELDAMAQRAEVFNALGTRLKAVEEIWAFGSVLEEAATDVGDLNICIVLTDSKFAKSLDDRQYADAAAAEAVMLGRPGRRYSAPFDIAKRAVIDGALKKITAPCEMHFLQSIGCPCKMIFSAARGPTPEGPTLPRHPESKGQSQWRWPVRSVDTKPAASFKKAALALAGQARHIHIGSRDATMETYGATNRQAINQILSFRRGAATVTGTELEPLLKPRHRHQIALMADTADWEVIGEVVHTKSGDVCDAIIAIKREISTTRVTATIRGWTQKGDPRQGAMAIALAMTLAKADALRAKARQGKPVTATLAFEHHEIGHEDGTSLDLALTALALKAAGAWDDVQVTHNGHPVELDDKEPQESEEAPHDQDHSDMVVNVVPEKDGATTSGACDFDVTFTLGRTILFGWEGAASNADDAFGKALRAMEHAAKAVAHATGGTIRPIPAGRIEARVERWSSGRPSSWIVGLPLLKACRGQKSINLKNAEAIRMASALVERDVRMTNRVTSQTEVIATVCGPTDQRHLTVDLGVYGLEDSDYMGESASSACHDDALAIIVAAAAQKSVKSDKSRHLRLDVPHVGSATFAAAIASGAASSWPQSRAEGHALANAIRETRGQIVAWPKGDEAKGSDAGTPQNPAR